MKTFLENKIIKYAFNLGGKFYPSLSVYYYNLVKNQKLKIFRKLIPESKIKLKQINTEEWDEISNHAPIYFLWWQGENNLPPIVELCYERVKKLSNKHPVVFISKNNYKEFLNNSKEGETIIKFIENDIITIQYFSDLLRSFLLSQHEGIWIDSTIFLLKPIDEIILNKKYYTGKRNWKKCIHKSPAEERWTGYFQTAGNNNTYNHFMLEALIEVINKYGGIPEYLTIDYLFALAYKDNNSFKQFIDSIPSINSVLWDLADSDKIMDKLTFESYIKLSPFYKLNWRASGKLKVDDNPTIFSHLSNINKKNIL